MTMLRPAPTDLPAALKEVVDYRKSGLSLNHVVGCPLDCGYCVRHLFENFDMKRPHLVMSDEAAVNLLTGHWAFRSGVTPIQIFNRATDPFLPGVKEHLFSTLELLDRCGYTNPVLVITRWRVEPEDVERLDQLEHVKLTILVTWSGIEDERIEPVDSAIAEQSLAALATHAARTKKILYWRPLIAGLNDTERHLIRAQELSTHADATVFTGVFFRDEMREYFRQVGCEDIYEAVARRKILPREVEKRILSTFTHNALFRKTSCGVAYAHGIADYNGHYCVRELCDICPSDQLTRCAKAHQKPDMDAVCELARKAQLGTEAITIDDRRVEVSGSAEQQRYFIQHMLNYQVHDKALPHFHNRHGRAEVGWS